MEGKRAETESCSAITVVSGFATGRGVTIGINLPCRVTAELMPRGGYSSEVRVDSAVRDPHSLVETCVLNSLRTLHVALKRDELVQITVNSEIPAAAGLKSSSALSVAVVKAIYDLFSSGYANNSQKILRLSCESSIESGASLTGAFDDAAAGLLGGLVFSDNLRFKLLSHRSLNPKAGSLVKLLVPSQEKLTSSLKLSDYRRYAREGEEAIHFAREEIITQAMVLNSMIHALIHRYSMQPIVSAIDEGAYAAGISGKGPAVAAICPNSKTGSRVEKRWLAENSNCKIVSASVTKARAS